jgi:predicted enzyme related to lactoylglutathione lyase
MISSVEVAIDATDAESAAEFWGQALGYQRLYDRDPYIVLGPPEGEGRPRFVIQRVDELSGDKNAVHVDLRADDPDAEVDRLRSLGASVAWVIDHSDRGSSRWTTMSDPQGLLFCVCSARSRPGEL